MKQSPKEQVAEVCYSLGCSGMGKSCPADPSCSILRKLLLPRGDSCLDQDQKVSM